MSNFNSADIAAFKDVWVFCEQREGKLMPTDFELISKGRDLANELGVNLCGLLLGGEGIESAAKELGGYGADKVIVCESPLLATYTTDGYAKVICDVIEDLKDDPLIDATTIGLKGSPTNIFKSFTPPQKGAGMMLEGADKATCEKLAGILAAKHII